MSREGASCQGRIQDFFFLGGGALGSCSTSTPVNHIIFFLQNTSCIRKPQVITGGGGGVGVRTPCTLPLDPPLVVYNDIYSVTMCGVVFGYVPNGGAMPLVKDGKMKNQIK